MTSSLCHGTLSAQTADATAGCCTEESIDSQVLYTSKPDSLFTYNKDCDDGYAHEQCSGVAMTGLQDGKTSMLML